MEISRTMQDRNGQTARGLLTAFLLLMSSVLWAQPIKAYVVKNGRMYIQFTREMQPPALDSFIRQYGLEDLDLATFLRTNQPDSLQKLGWKVEMNNETGVVLSKAFEPLKDFDSKQLLSQELRARFPSVSNRFVVGINRFHNKAPFATNDSVVRFFLRQQTTARQVMLAGSFNQWVPDNLPMRKTDSGWIADVKLGPGKYWYKFIADGHWLVDADNLLSENDGRGNINSVFYKTNFVFRLNGFLQASKVFLAGSFNNWKADQLPMRKTPTGWELPLYLADGTHTYKFVVDGTWQADGNNKDQLPDGNGGYNSVVSRGTSHLFRLNNFTGAKQVTVSGSFNKWRDDELPMKKTAAGWELPYTLGPGNHEYVFQVDGKPVRDPDNPLSSASTGRSYLIIQPNYTFRLNGFSKAKEVYLAGDFNDWDPQAYAMKRDGEDWTFTLHLSPGKHLYKFVIDGKWIIDPANRLWEPNEYGTNNSVLWKEQ